MYTLVFTPLDCFFKLKFLFSFTEKRACIIYTKIYLHAATM